MKLFDKICSPSVLTEAWQTVRKKNAKGGIDGVSPQDMDVKISETIEKLSRKLMKDAYTPAPYQQIKIPKFNDANEWRSLSLPIVEDKIVQQAAVNVMMPVFEKDFLDCSYAYRQKKGPGKALGRIEHIIRTHKISWIVSYDIDNFFDSMNHALLVRIISEKIDEPPLISLINLWLKSGYINQKGDFLEADEGIAQGSVISPLLSNIYLHKLDQFTVDKKYSYVRYSDNFIGLFHEKEKAFIYRDDIRKYTKENLFLEMNVNKNPVQNINAGFVFLGIYFKGNEREISKGKENKTFKKLEWITAFALETDLNTVIKRINESVSSQKRYYSHIKPLRQFLAFDEFLIKRVKNLLITNAEKGLIKKLKKELVGIIVKIEFYKEMNGKEKAQFAEKIAKEIMITLKKADHKPPMLRSDVKPDAKKSAAEISSTNKRRVNTRTNKYLREISDIAEVVVTTPGVFIGKTGKRLVLRQARKNICEQPFSKIRQITVAATGVSLSSDVIRSCVDSHVPIIFINHYGKPVAMIQSPEFSMGGLALLQLKMYETDKALKLAARVLNGKCRNQMNLIKFYTRHRSKTDPVFHEQVVRSLEKMKNSLEEMHGAEQEETFEKSRGKLFLNEARISGYYWNIIKILLPPELGFTKREKKGAGDVVNNMLNYGYGILYQRVWNAVVMADMSPNISFLHAIQKRKPTLIYDLIEEFRQTLVDRPIFSIMTKGRRYETLKVDSQTGLLDKQTKEIALRAVLNRLSSLTGYRGKKVRAEDIIYLQAENMAKYISGKQRLYKPFISTY